MCLHLYDVGTPIEPYWRGFRMSFIAMLESCPLITRDTKATGSNIAMSGFGLCVVC